MGNVKLLSCVRQICVTRKRVVMCYKRSQWHATFIKSFHKSPELLKGDSKVQGQEKARSMHTQRVLAWDKGIVGDIDWQSYVLVKSVLKTNTFSNCQIVDCTPENYLRMTQEVELENKQISSSLTTIIRSQSKLQNLTQLVPTTIQLQLNSV